MKITSTGASQTNLTGQSPNTIGGRAASDPMVVLLFGKRPSKRVDRRKYPKLRKAMRKLEYVRDEIAERMGVPPKAFELELCEGNSAWVGRDGTIGIGVEFLEENEDDDELLVAVLAHEMGHQPWTWPTEDISGLKRSEREHLHREEEAKADRFAGRMLAELSVSPEAVCRYLQQHEAFEKGNPSQEYYPAEVRARMIRESHGRRRRVVEKLQGKHVRNLR